MPLNQRIPVIVSLIILITAISATAEAKSVYVIADTTATPSPLQAYDIQGSSLVYQATHSLSRAAAVGLAIDADSDSGFLFVTFEATNIIETIEVDAETMVSVGTVTAPGASDLAGIVADHGRSKLYVIDRETSNLYVYSWNAVTKELTLDLPDPYYVELEDCYQGYGLALDEENNRLYVADNTTNVKYYDTNDPDWPKLG